MTTYQSLASQDTHHSTQNWYYTGTFYHVLALLCGSAIGAATLFSPWLAIAALLALGAGFFFLTRPITLCYMLVGTIVTSSGMERGLVVPLLKPNEIAFLLAAGLTILMALAKRTIRITGTTYSWFSLLTLGLGTVALPLGAYIIRGVALSTQDLLTLVAPLQYFLVFWVFAALPQTERQRFQLLFCMILGGGLVAFIGLLQAANVPFIVTILENYYPSSHGDVASEAGRVTSLLGAWNATGIFLMVSTLVGWSILPESNSGAERIILNGTLILIQLALIATGSFAGMGVMLLGLVLISFIQGRGVRILSIILLGIVVVIAIAVLLQPILGPMIEQRLTYQFWWHPRTKWLDSTDSFVSF